MKVLVVDDSASMRGAIRFTLEGAGYEVAEAADGQLALRALDSGVKLVLTDLNMPNMNGIELVRQIRACGRFPGLPIVLVTTESQDEKKQEGKKAGATGWIVKPFRPEQLLTVVKKVLG